LSIKLSTSPEIFCIDRARDSPMTGIYIPKLGKKIWEIFSFLGVPDSIHGLMGLKFGMEESTFGKGSRMPVKTERTSTYTV